MSTDVIIAGGVLAVGFLAQFAAICIWGSGVSHRLNTAEAAISELEKSNASQSLIPAEIARLEERLQNLVDQFRDLNSWLRVQDAGNPANAVARARRKPAD